MDIAFGTGVEVAEIWTVFVSPQDTESIGFQTEEKEHGVLLEPTRQRLKRVLHNPDPAVQAGVPTYTPEILNWNGISMRPSTVIPILGQADLRPLLGTPPFAIGTEQTPDESACGRVAYLFIRVASSSRQRAVFGFGADLALSVWMNGRLVYESNQESLPFPPTVHDIQREIDLNEGSNLLFIRFVSGKGSSVIALGGPALLREGNHHSILNDPILAGEKDWTTEGLKVSKAPSEAVQIGNQRELFVDDFLIDQLSSAAELRLHHPQPKEIVFEFNEPWEGNFNGCFQPVSIFRADDQILMYYKGANYGDICEPSQCSYNSRDRSRPQIACVAHSSDGISFERPKLNLIEVLGSKANNVVWDGPHYFTPFLDLNPDVPDDSRFKAISGHRNGGLGVYRSADGLSWRSMSDDPITRKGAFDSQNLAFWDSTAGVYREYHRGSEQSGPRRGVRGIMTSTSSDFLNWSEPQSLDYFDDLPHQLYTNCIRPYERAPHILLGTPGRIIGSRRKLSEHPDQGVTDTLLMAGRGGQKFKCWPEAFIRPDADQNNWADRNTFTAWGMVQTSPDEISLYWCEHNGFPTMRLRRGVLRLDGFVSLHAGASVGEMLTKPFYFRGNALSVNYATSAAGSLRFELCRPDGSPLPGRALRDSDILYGNELDALVAWNRSSDVSAYSNIPVRLRVRLQDADLFSIQFQDRN